MEWWYNNNARLSVKRGGTGKGGGGGEGRKFGRVIAYSEIPLSCQLSVLSDMMTIDDNDVNRGQLLITETSIPESSIKNIL